jgi:hypothetical protein
VLCGVDDAQRFRAGTLRLFMERERNLATSVIPTSKSLYLCDYEFGADSGKIDLYGIFNAIRPTSGYPYAKARFCVFAQLVNGLGRVPFNIDIRNAQADQLVHTTHTNSLLFPSRTTVVQMAVQIEGCAFPQAGLYLVELFCNNTWVCDAPLMLLEESERSHE